MKDLKDLLKELEDNKEKEVKSIDQLIDYYQSFNDRNLLIGEIGYEISVAVDSVIRFWNKVDEEDNVPVDKRKPIKIYIQSPGGFLTSTFTMIDAIKLSKTPVYTINVGIAYSGGFFTFICGHKRFAYPHSSFLFHEGNMTLGNMDANKFRNAADFYDKQLDLIEKVVLERTNIAQENYDKHRKDDWWILADEALELGICDEIIKDFI